MIRHVFNKKLVRNTPWKVTPSGDYYKVLYYMKTDKDGNIPTACVMFSYDEWVQNGNEFPIEERVTLEEVLLDTLIGIVEDIF